MCPPAPLSTAESKGPPCPICDDHVLPAPCQTMQENQRAHTQRPAHESLRRRARKHAARGTVERRPKGREGVLGDGHVMPPRPQPQPTPGSQGGSPPAKFSRPHRRKFTAPQEVRCTPRDRGAQCVHLDVCGPCGPLCRPPPAATAASAATGWCGGAPADQPRLPGWLRQGGQAQYLLPRPPPACPPPSAPAGN